MKTSAILMLAGLVVGTFGTPVQAGDCGSSGYWPDWRQNSKYRKKLHKARREYREERHEAREDFREDAAKYRRKARRHPRWARRRFPRKMAKARRKYRHESYEAHRDFARDRRRIRRKYGREPDGYYGPYYRRNRGYRSYDYDGGVAVRAPYVRFRLWW